MNNKFNKPIKNRFLTSTHSIRLVILLGLFIIIASVPSMGGGIGG